MSTSPTLKRKVSDASLDEDASVIVTGTSLTQQDSAPTDDKRRPAQRPRIEESEESTPQLAPSSDVQPKSNETGPSPITLSYPDVGKSSNVRPTSFQQPTQIISFSHDEQHAQRFDKSALRYYVDPPIGARLDYGYDRWIRKPDERGRLDGLLNALTQLKNDPERAMAVPDSGVVCWRGIMTKILTAPYEDRDGWDLNVMFVNGVLYFEEHLTESRLQEKNDMPPRQRLQTYYGYAFESYCTSDTPTRQPPRQLATAMPVPFGWGGNVNTNVQWCSVVRTKLGDTRIVLGGEVDCVRGRYTGRTDTFVELKTSTAIRGANDERRFEKKLLKFYFQSFLLGVPEIVVGFRTPSGVITTTQTFKTLEIPRQVRGKPGAWNPMICLEWGDRFLSTMKDIALAAQTATGGDAANASAAARNVWRASFVPGTGVTVRLLDPSEVEEVVNMEDRIGFLPRWYWSEVQQHAAQPVAPRAPVVSPPPLTVAAAAQVGSSTPSADARTEAAPPQAASYSGWVI